MKERSKEVTHKIMASIRAKDTKPELVYRLALWAHGVRYRKHVSILGKPDIAIKKYKVAVFIDGDFWHGNNWKLRNLPSLDAELETYSKFWKNKILANVERDRQVTRSLESDGWTVLRFWQSDIESRLGNCISQTIEILEKRKSEI